MLFVRTAPSGRELSSERETEGERVSLKYLDFCKSAFSFRHAVACHLPPGGRLLLVTRFTGQLITLCMAVRPIQNALVRSQYHLGLCPKLKYLHFDGGIFILQIKSLICIANFRKRCYNRGVRKSHKKCASNGIIFKEKKEYVPRIQFLQFT